MKNRDSVTVEVHVVKKQSSISQSVESDFYIITGDHFVGARESLFAKCICFLSIGKNNAVEVGIPTQVAQSVSSVVDGPVIAPEYFVHRPGNRSGRLPIGHTGQSKG